MSFNGVKYEDVARSLGALPFDSKVFEREQNHHHNNA